MITDSEKLDKVFYSEMGIRLLLYIMWFVLCSTQTVHEFIHSKKNKTKKTRLFSFAAMTMFCVMRITGNIEFYFNPSEYDVGTLWYFFFSWGVFFIFVEWSFIAAFWIQLFYTFFISEEVRLKNAKYISNSVYVYVSIYFCWQVIITVLCLKHYKNYKDIENIGFIVFFIFMFLVMLFNGLLLLRAFKTQRKKSKVDFKLMIKKTKILVAGMVICVVITIVHDSVIMFDAPHRPYNFPLSVLLTGVADMLQLIVVMYVLADGQFSTYFTFKRVYSHHHHSTNQSSNDSQNAHKLASSNVNNNSISISIDNNNSKRNNSFIHSNDISIDISGSQDILPTPGNDE